MVLDMTESQEIVCKGLDIKEKLDPREFNSTATIKQLLYLLHIAQDHYQELDSHKVESSELAN